MAELPFISNSPVMDAYNRAQKSAQEQEAADLSMQHQQFRNQQEVAEGPTRLRKLGAEATTAEASAKFAEPMARAHLRATEAAAHNSYMQGFYKSLELLNQGDVAGAQEVARRSGQQIPDAVVQDAELRQTVTAVARRAQELYPTRPKDQQAFIQGKMEDLMARRQHGERISPTTEPYTMPAGAPTPPEQGGQHQGEIERIAGALMKENPKLTYAEALQQAHRSPQNDDLRRERLALDAAKAENPDLSTLPKWRSQYGIKSGTPRGTGTKQDPYVASDQSHVDWFKQNAPPGSVLNVDGQLFTK